MTLLFIKKAEKQRYKVKLNQKNSHGDQHNDT